MRIPFWVQLFIFLPSFLPPVRPPFLNNQFRSRFFHNDIEGLIWRDGWTDGRTDGRTDVDGRTEEWSSVGRMRMEADARTDESVIKPRQKWYAGNAATASVGISSFGTRDVGITNNKRTEFEAASNRREGVSGPYFCPFVETIRNRQNHSPKAGSASITPSLDWDAQGMKLFFPQL